jgi:protein-S-isoprenylcysteine O-methyltransferase Ste14
VRFWGREVLKGSLCFAVRRVVGYGLPVVLPVKPRHVRHSCCHVFPRVEMVVDMKSGWRWGNVPLPEAHLVLIVIGVVLNGPWPLHIGSDTAWASWSAVILIVLGVVVIVWATVAAGRVKLADPDRLVTTGPYGMSRHPMYVAWTIIYLGLVLLLDSAWLLILTPVLAVVVHWQASREENRLVEAFGSDYEEYRNRVRSYL